eukprot:SAG31_NODE_1603_length_7767_cov_10.433359_8_plen_101_part_00
MKSVVELTGRTELSSIHKKKKKTMVLGGETAAPYRPQRDLSSPVTLLDVDEALMLAGFGRHQLLLFAVCGLGWSADVGELRLIGFLLRGDTLGWQVKARV